MEPNHSTNDMRSIQPLGASAATHTEIPYPADAHALRDALEDVVESVEVLLRRADGFLGQYAEQRPHVLLAAAAGLGFVLGGGLASRTGSSLARVGGRLLLAHWLQRLTRGEQPPSDSPAKNPAF